MPELRRMSDGAGDCGARVEAIEWNEDGTFKEINYGCSMVVHHAMIENFLKDRFPIRYDRDHRLAYTDATNFHHVLHFAKEERNKRVKLAEI